MCAGHFGVRGCRDVEGIRMVLKISEMCKCQSMRKCGFTCVEQVHTHHRIPKIQEGLNVCIFKRNEPKPFTLSRLTVQHNCRIDDLPELGEELAHRLRGDAASKASNEQFSCPLMLLSRNSSLRINLKKEGKVYDNGWFKRFCVPYNFSIQEMFSHHYGIDTSWVVES